MSNCLPNVGQKCSSLGVKVLTIQLEDFAGKKCGKKLYGGFYYGWRILKGSWPTGFITQGGGRADDQDGIPIVQGRSLVSRCCGDSKADSPLFELYIRIPETDAAGTVKIAVYTEPVSIESPGAADPITYDRPSSGSVGAADANVETANAARRFFYIRNTHATNKIWLSFGDFAAVASMGIEIRPGEEKIFGVNDDPIYQRIRVIADGAGTTYLYQTGE